MSESFLAAVKLSLLISASARKLLEYYCCHHMPDVDNANNLLLSDTINIKTGKMKETRDGLLFSVERARCTETIDRWCACANASHVSVAPLVARWRVGV